MAGLIKLLLFDLNPAPSPTGATAGKHALNRTYITGTIWLYMHMPINACLVVIGALLEPLKADAQISYYASLTLSSATACLILMTTILDLQHDEGIKRRRVNRIYRVIVSCCFALMMVALWFVKDWHESSALSYDYVLFIDIILMLYVVFTFYSHFPPNVKRSKEELCRISECNGQLDQPLIEADGGDNGDGNLSADDGIIDLYGNGNVPCECY